MPHISYSLTALQVLLHSTPANHFIGCCATTYWRKTSISCKVCWFYEFVYSTASFVPILYPFPHMDLSFDWVAIRSPLPDQPHFVLNFIPADDVLCKFMQSCDTVISHRAAFSLGSTLSAVPLNLHDLYAEKKNQKSVGDLRCWAVSQALDMFSWFKAARRGFLIPHSHSVAPVHFIWGSWVTKRLSDLSNPGN